MMAPNLLEEESLISSQVLQQLSQTPYACSSLIQLPSREANRVYRGILEKQFQIVHNGFKATSVIIKHSIDIPSTDANSQLDGLRCIFDEFMFNSVADFSLASTIGTMIKSPRLYSYNHETRTQILEDFSDTVGLKATLFSSNLDSLLPSSSPGVIGRNLGTWLRSFHTWTSAPEQATLRAQLLKDDPMRKLKRSLTYGCFLGTLKQHPEILGDNKQILETIQDALNKEFEKSPTDVDEDWGIIHGDLWSGNILIPRAGWQELPPFEELNKLFIIDWEYAQFGHRCYDLGQIIGDLYERKIYNNNDAGLVVLEGIIAGYGELSSKMAFRTAIHVGVHLIGYYGRRPQRGPWVASPEAIVAGLTIARDFIIKGWREDKTFFEDSWLASLFITE